ncbi:MAG: hypothetical protein H7227_05235 [Actinobacteria bacterium]|nr:hypothetical protein [Actinomycetota bacterium]
MQRKIILLSAWIALLWNLYLVAGATLNIEAILPRVAGGGFESMPTGLRFIYGVQTLLVGFQFFFLARLYYRNGAWSKNSYLITRIFLALSAVGALVNAVSRSHLERWNAISAAVIAIAFYVLGNVKTRPAR